MFRAAFPKPVRCRTCPLPTPPAAYRGQKFGWQFAALTLNASGQHVIRRVNQAISRLEETANTEGSPPCQTRFQGKLTDGGTLTSGIRRWSPIAPQTRQQPRIPPLRSVIANRDSQSLPLPHQYQQPFASRDSGVNQIPLQEHVVLHG